MKNTRILAYSIYMPHKCSHVSSVHSHAFYAICTLHCSNKAVFISPFGLTLFICSGEKTMISCLGSSLFTLPYIQVHDLISCIQGFHAVMKTAQALIKIHYNPDVLHLVCLIALLRPAGQCCHMHNSLLSYSITIILLSHNLLFIIKIWLLSNMANKYSHLHRDPWH